MTKKSEELLVYREKHNQLEKTIQQQEDMLTYNTIPKKYKPQTVLSTIQPNDKLTDDFNRKYETLFFNHLHNVLTNNKIAFETTKSTTDKILAQTETYLSSTQVPSQTITEIYHNFLTTNKITNHKPLPILQNKLSQTSTHSNPTPNHNQDTDIKPKKRRTKKRKQPIEQPNSDKKSKSFLSPGPQCPLKPP